MKSIQRINNKNKNNDLFLRLGFLSTQTCTLGKDNVLFKRSHELKLAGNQHLFWRYVAAKQRFLTQRMYLQYCKYIHTVFHE